MHMMKHASEGIHPGFEKQDRLHKKYKTGVSKRTHFLSDLFEKVFVFPK